MNELILKITNLAISYPNQLSKFFAISKVNDKIDWKLFTIAVSEYLELNCNSESPIISVFTNVLNEVNDYFCRIICVYDYDRNSIRKIEEFSRKENIEIQVIVEQREEPPINNIQKIFSWIKNLFINKGEDVIDKGLEIKSNSDTLCGKMNCLIPLIRI